MSRQQEPKTKQLQYSMVNNHPEFGEDGMTSRIVKDQRRDK